MRHGGGVPAGAGGASWLMGVAGFTATLVVIALVALLVLYFVRRARGGVGPLLPAFAGIGRHPAVAASSGLQILDQRLATGDIAVEDYLTRRSALTDGAAVLANMWPTTGFAPAVVPVQDEPDPQRKESGPSTVIPGPEEGVGAGSEPESR